MIQLGDYVVVKYSRSFASERYHGKVHKVVWLDKNIALLDIDSPDASGGFWIDELSLVAIPEEDYEYI